jgi:hypothetical protein
MSGKHYVSCRRQLLILGEHCSGPMRIIAPIEAPEVIEKILEHSGLDDGEAIEPLPRALPGRAELLD